MVKATEYTQEFNKLKTQRQNWESHWQEIADYCLPRRADVTKSRSKGDKRTEFIYDGTALHALELLSSSLHGMLTNAASPWFDMRFKDERMANDEESLEWLEEATRTLYTVFARSNFQQEIHEVYTDLVSFGTACMLIESDSDNVIRFSTRHIKEVYASENFKGIVDTVHREFKITARAAVAQFGKGLPKEILKKAEENPFEEVVIHHCVKPNAAYNPLKADVKAMPFKSVYYHKDDNVIISESGYMEFPYVVPRWLKSSSETYGRSPSMTALPDIKMLNKMSETTIKAAQKMVDPPLLVPDDSFVLPVRTQPGGLNFYRSGSRDRIEPLNIGANTPVGLNLEEQRRKAIQQTYFIDQLISEQNQRMTATEVMQRNEEKMRMLAPVLGRLQSEMLRPLIDRVFNILLRNNYLSTPPQQLQGQTIDIEYVSPLARSQRQGDVQAIMRTMEMIGPLSNQLPVMDHIDPDMLVRHITDVLGVPRKVLRSNDEITQVREERQKAEAEVRQQKEVMEAAQAAGQAAPMLKQLQQGE